MKMAGKIRAYLECREPNGSTKFYRTDKVLASVDLQNRCIEKRALEKIIKRITASDHVQPQRLH